MKDFKVIELVLDEENEISGIQAISIVDDPAIEEEFIALASQDVKLAQVDEDLTPSFDASHEHDATQATTGGVAVDYTTHNNTGTFDNYALLNTKFDFFRANCPKDQEIMNSRVLLTGISNINSQVGSIFFLQTFLLVFS